MAAFIHLTKAYMTHENLAPRQEGRNGIENIPEAIEKVKSLIAQNVHDDRRKSVINLALNKVSADVSLRPPSQDHIDRAGNAFIAIAAMTIDSLAEIADDPDIIAKLFDDLQLAFWHVPGNAWEYAELKVKTRLARTTRQ